MIPWKEGHSFKNIHKNMEINPKTINKLLLSTRKQGALNIYQGKVEKPYHAAERRLIVRQAKMNSRITSPQIKEG